MFDANIEAINVTEITFDDPGVLTRFVRIYPTDCRQDGSTVVYCVMQFEILGCKYRNGLVYWFYTRPR